MKKPIISIFLSVILAGALSGCGSGLREFPLDFLNGNEVGEVIESLSDFAVDQSGAASLVHGGQYLLMSQEGDILAEYSPEGGSVKRLVILYDGRIAFEVTMKENGGTALQYMDRDTLETVTLAALEKSALYLTLLDGETLLYAAQDGVPQRAERGRAGADLPVEQPWHHNPWGSCPSGR